MPTKTETRTDEKNRDAAADRKREQARQQLRLERARKLAKVGSDQTAAIQKAHADARAARRKVWDEFHEGMAKLRRPA